MKSRGLIPSFCIGLTCLFSLGFQKQTEHVLELHIVDKKTKEPIADAAVYISMLNGPSRKDGTDAQGRCWIILPAQKMKYLRLIAKSDGHVSKVLEWRNAENGDVIPDTYTLSLDAGTTIGGIVQDEQGQPIDGVTLSIDASIDADDRSPREYNTVYAVSLATGPDGKWTYSSAPENLKNLYIRPLHPKYVTEDQYGWAPRFPDGELHAGTAAIIMKRGIELKGHVTDADGKPVVGASVVHIISTTGSQGPKMTSDIAGIFSFTNMRAGSTSLLVQAKGNAPDLVPVEIKKDMPPLEVKLGPPKTLRGRVLDSAGNPVPGATLTPGWWRQHQVLDVRLTTNADGRFVWPDAPSDEIQFTLSKSGFRSQAELKTTAGDKDYLFSLRAPLQVSGTVVDAATGKALTKFMAVPGSGRAGSPVYYDRRNANSSTDGKYTVEFTDSSPAHLVLIEAEGYLPARSRTVKDTEPSQTIDFKLEKGVGPHGIVKLPNGQPAADAEVALYTAVNSLSIRNGQLDKRSGTGSAIIKTDASGKFSFPPQAEPFGIMIFHDAGSAHLSQEQVKATAPITLQPWATIRGRVVVGAKPAPKASVALATLHNLDQRQPQIHYYYDQTTDQDGQFTFSRVPPGEWRVDHVLHKSLGEGFFTDLTLNSIHSQLNPGQTVEVTIGGTGRPLVGRVVLPPDAKRSERWKFNIGHMYSKLPEPVLPENRKTMTQEQVLEWNQKRNQSNFRAFHNYPLLLNDDGSFRVEDVVPGTYSLHVGLVDPTGGPNLSFGKYVAQVDHEFTLPEIPGGRTDEPLDLGQLQLKLLDEPKPPEKK
jgi:protocatechuate 3,4-dioxygenase beta subunit